MGSGDELDGGRAEAVPGAVAEYAAWLRDTFGSPAHAGLVWAHVDCANGAAVPVAPAVFPAA